MFRKVLMLTLFLAILSFKIQAQEKVTYKVVADSNDFFVHIKAAIFDADMWVQNMNIGSSLVVDVGLNKRMKVTGTGYWAHFYDGGMSSRKVNGSEDLVEPVKTPSPTFFWDLGFNYNYKVNKTKANIPLHVSSSQEKFLNQVIAVNNKRIYVPGTVRSSRSITARIEGFSTLINLEKNADKAEFQMSSDDGQVVPFGSVPMSTLSTGGYYHTQMNATSAYIGWRTTLSENHIIVKTSKGKLKNFNRVSYYVEFAPISIVQFGDLSSMTQDGKIWKVQSDQTVGRGWRAGFDVQMSQKRTTMYSQVSIGQRPGYRRVFFNVKWGYILFAYEKKHG